MRIEMRMKIKQNAHEEMKTVQMKMLSLDNGSLQLYQSYQTSGENL